MSAIAFSELGLPDALVKSLAARGITETFDIQSLTIPAALAGRDVCGRAPTGSGKTIAFGIPVAQRVQRSRPKHPQALILTPTRELAAQINEEMKALLAPHRRTSATFYGGVGFGPQTNALRKGVDVAIACPGRLADLIRRREIILDEVSIVVIDEADRMADMGFLPEVRKILDQVRPDRQTLLFSATLDGDVDTLIRHYQVDPLRAESTPSAEHIDRTSHTFLPVKREDRVSVAAGLAHNHGSTVVFCRTKHGADRVAMQLEREGLTAVAIHGGRSQRQRDRALDSFTRGRAQVLVATDVAARGIHVDDVQCVVHFDLPADHKDYVHRSGRTGRAGAEGTVVTLVTSDENGKARSLIKALGMPAEPALGQGSRSDSGDRRASGARKPYGSGRPGGSRSGSGRTGGSGGRSSQFGEHGGRSERGSRTTSQRSR